MEGFFDGRKTRALFPSRVHLWGFQFFGGRKTRASFPSLLWRDFLMGEKLALYNCSHRCTRALSIFRWAREKNSRVTPIEFGRSKLITEYNFHRFCRLNFVQVYVVIMIVIQFTTDVSPKTWGGWGNKWPWKFYRREIRAIRRGCVCFLFTLMLRISILWTYLMGVFVGNELRELSLNVSVGIENSVWQYGRSEDAA